MSIDSLKGQNGYTVSELCDLFEIPRSSYYKWLKREKPKKEIQYELICDWIRQCQKENNGILGYRRMTMYINKEHNTTYSVNYIHRLMKKIKLQSRIRRKRYNYIKSKSEQIGENILNRDFTTTAYNQKWLTDVTEFKASDGTKIYLSAILDLHSNYIVSYKFSIRNDNSLVFETFRQAIKANPYAKPIFHSDRGFQYTSKVFKYMLDQQGMKQSMSRVGKCIDNGPMEAFWGTVKSECFYSFKFEDRESIINAVTQYIEYYNNKRLQQKLNSMAPMMYRNHAISVLNRN